MKSTPLVLVTLLAITATTIYADHRPDHDQVGAENSTSRIRAAMESAEIVPDVVGKAPSQLIKVSWSDKTSVTIAVTFICSISENDDVSTKSQCHCESPFQSNFIKLEILFHPSTTLSHVDYLPQRR